MSTRRAPVVESGASVCLAKYRLDGNQMREVTHIILGGDGAIVQGEHLEQLPGTRDTLVASTYHCDRAEIYQKAFERIIEGVREFQIMTLPLNHTFQIE
jgi:hypothetical protein